MQSITFDCRQLDKVDWSLHVPVQIGRASARRRADGVQRATLLSALRLGAKLDNAVAKAHKVSTIATSPPTARLLAPPSMPGTGPLVIRLSKSASVTGALGLDVSANMVVGVLGGVGIYASTTRELGVYNTVGGGIFSSPGVTGGAEYTVIYGTPADFSGLYFGLSVGGGVGVLSGGGTLLFSPTSFGVPTVLTLMGFSLGIAASTPTELPVYVSVTVTNTKITALHRW